MPSNEDKKEKLRALIKEELTQLKKELMEEVAGLYTKAVLPHGYIRCKVCGEIIREDEECPYCKLNKLNESESDDLLEGVI